MNRCSACMVAALVLAGPGPAIAIDAKQGASAIKCCYAAIGSRLSSTMNKML